MSDKSTIEWTDATWNVLTGCSIKSPGCARCYAMKLAAGRLRNHASRKGLAEFVNGQAVWTGEVRFNEQWLRDPIKWKEPRDIFVCAHSDLFHEKVADAQLGLIFGVMVDAPWHRYQVLTKRSGRLRRFVENASAALPHVILGVSVENQQYADERREDLRVASQRGWQTFCSYEPALGAVDWETWDFLSWMISGGESGGDSHPTHPDWHRATRDFCASNNIPYLFKQWGSWTVIVDRDKDDPDWRADYTVVNRKPGYRILNLAGGHGFHGERVCLMRHVAKKAAGRLLDGREHNDMPSPISKVAA